MLSVYVAQQCILGRSSVAAVLTDVQLGAPLLVSILLCHTMDLLHVGLQGAALGEGFLTQITLIWTDTWGEYRERHMLKQVYSCVYLSPKFFLEFMLTPAQEDLFTKKASTNDHIANLWVALGTAICIVK